MKTTFFLSLILAFIVSGCQKKTIPSAYKLPREKLVNQLLDKTDYSSLEIEVQIWIQNKFIGHENLIVLQRKKNGKSYGVVYDNWYDSNKKEAFFRKRRITIPLDSLFEVIEKNRIEALPEKVNLPKYTYTEDGILVNRISMGDGYQYIFKVFINGKKHKHSYHCPKSYGNFNDPEGNTQRVVNILEAILKITNLNHTVC